MLEGSRTKTWHLLQLSPRVEGSVLLPVVYDILCQGGPQSADVHQEMLRGGIEVDTHEVDATLYGLVEGMLEFRLVYVVLILPHADALGVNLDKFCEGIHQSSAYRDGSTNGDVF